MARIGIIGAGHVGAALTRSFRHAGHEVGITNTRGASSLDALVRETGARATTLEAMLHDCAIVVVAIPMARIGELPRALFEAAPAELIVIDANNYYPQQRDGLIAEIDAGSTESAWVERQLGRPVVKVFNTIIAEYLLEKRRPSSAPDRIALAVAGDDARAKSIAMRLVDEIGFDAVDAGTIEQSWRQQPGTPGYLADLPAAALRAALAAASPTRTAPWRATPDSPGTYDSPA